MSDKPSSEDILKCIKDSGYLFEQEIATILEENDFHVQTNKAFEDLDTKKSREIDIFAIKRIFHDEKSNFSKSDGKNCLPSCLLCPIMSQSLDYLCLIFYRSKTKIRATS